MSRDEVGGDADAQIVHVGEALAGREARPPVHHHRAVAERARQRDQRHRHVAGPDDGQDGGRRQHLHERAHPVEERVLDLPPRAGRPRFLGDAPVQLGVAEGALHRPVVEHEPLRPVPLGVQPGHDGGPAARLGVGAGALVEGQGGVAGPVERHRLHEYLDGAAAGQPDLPGFLVA